MDFIFSSKPNIPLSKPELGLRDFSREVALPLILKEHGGEKKSRMLSDSNVIDLSMLDIHDIERYGTDVIEQSEKSGDKEDLFLHLIPCFMSGVYILPTADKKKLYAKYKVSDLDVPQLTMSLDIDFFSFQEYFKGTDQAEWGLMSSIHVDDNTINDDAGRDITGKTIQDMLYEVVTRPEMRKIVEKYTDRKPPTYSGDSQEEREKKDALFSIYYLKFICASLYVNKMLDEERLQKGKRVNEEKKGRPAAGKTEKAIIGFGEPSKARYIRKLGPVFITSGERPQAAKKRAVAYTKAAWPTRGGIRHYTADRYVNMKGRTGYFKPSVHHRSGLQGEESKETIIMENKKEDETG